MPLSHFDFHDSPRRKNRRNAPRTSRSFYPRKKSGPIADGTDDLHSLPQEPGFLKRILNTKSSSMTHFSHSINMNGRPKHGGVEQEQRVRDSMLATKQVSRGYIHGTSPRSISTAMFSVDSPTKDDRDSDCFDFATSLPASDRPHIDSNMASKARKIRDAMNRLLDELSPPLGAPEDPTDPWRRSHPSHVRASTEWETETLLESGPETDRVPYPCPFRRQNPVRFNIREHESCARAPFFSMSDML